MEITMRPIPVIFAALLSTAGALAAGALAAPPPPTPDNPVAGDAVIQANAVIRAKAGPSEIVITTTRRVAGAIHSLRWNGKEFLDSADHGRQLQSASNFDCGTTLTAETFNPTEAGSMFDGAGPRSTSELLAIRADGADLETTSRMAFWLRPGEKSGGHPAKNTTVLSNHLLHKRVHIGCRDLPHAISYDVTFTVPKGEHHTSAVFEALTGYMPPEFSRFWKFERASGELKPLDDGPAEQACPVVLATPSGSHAMGIFSPDQPSPGFEKVGYGYFRFEAEKVNKWNCVFRRGEPDTIDLGKYEFRMFVIVGTLGDVRNSMRNLDKDYPQDAYFVCELPPEEGIPHFRAKTDLIVYEYYSRKARRVEGFTIPRETYFEGKETRFITIKPAEIVLDKDMKLDSDKYGKIKRLTANGYYHSRKPVDLELRKGQKVSYLQYRAEGEGFIEFEGEVYTVFCSDLDFTEPPQTEWWEKVVVGQKEGWVLIETDTVASERTF
jgi:hypothetical protein